MRLWQTASTPLHEATLHFTVGDDPSLDKALLPFDCLASAAHASMLAEIGVLSSDELQALIGALKTAFERAQAGQFAISIEQEDGHTALEQFLTEQTQEAGKKIHTGRSRNDQVMAAVRLYAREQLLAIAESSIALATALGNKATAHATDPMPGYTHTRQAMPSTIGQFFGAVAEDLLRDLEGVLLALQVCNRSVLGSASGYGVPLPLKRHRVAELLGLGGIEHNTLHAQNTRGKVESTAIFAMHQLSLTLSRFASDLIWWSSEAFGFFRLPEALTTGSSIMPQKRNPDLLELSRAMPSTMLARYTEVTGLLHGLPAGYHRDLQRTKAPFILGVKDCLGLLAIMQCAVETIEVDAKRSEEALGADIFATDRAYEHVRAGVSFREAYRHAKTAVDTRLDARQTLAARSHEGAPGQPQEAVFKHALAHLQQALKPFHQGAAIARQLLH